MPFVDLSETSADIITARNPSTRLKRRCEHFSNSADDDHPGKNVGEEKPEVVTLNAPSSTLIREAAHPYILKSL